MQAKAIIIKPIHTEKSTRLNDKKVYAFIINRKSTKIDVKRALKEIYGAVITDVRIINFTSKVRKVRKGIMTKRPEGKKAYVTVAADSKLDLTQPAKGKAIKAAKEVEIKVKADGKNMEDKKNEPITKKGAAAKTAKSPVKAKSTSQRIKSK